MKKPKALVSAIVAAALLVSAALPAAAEAAAVPSGAAAAQTSGADASTFSWDNATVYFLLTDRFKNGDTSNDNAYGRQDINVGDQRATFHGGDFAGITQKIEEGYFNDLGVNAIWLTAPYEQIHGYIQGGPGFAHYSYHGYYVLDYTETDAAYGTKEEFKKMVDTAHAHGIRIVMDIVMNHAGYNSMADMNEYNFGTLKSGWQDVYNSGNIDNYHSVIDYDSNDWTTWWGPDWIRSGLKGYTEGGNDPLTSSLSGLPDFKTEQSKSVGLPPLLVTKWTKEGTLSQKQSKYGTSNTVTGFISTWLADWVREYGIDGFRCDTAKHVEYASWKQLKDAGTKALAEWKANNPDKKLDDLPFWMTGECWDHGVGYDDYYKQGGFDSMINFETTGGGLLDASKLSGVYDRYASSINTNDNFNVLSYISSHDSTLARGDMYHYGSAFLMLPGAVQIYYGDETNRPLVSGCPFDGNGGAGHSLRSDMNWDSIDQDVLAHWQKVGTFRSNHVAVGGGANVALTASSGVGFGRTYSKNGVNDKVAGVIDAAANTDVTLDVSGVFEDGTTLVNFYDETSDTVTGGKVTFSSGEHGTILLEEGAPDPVKVAVKGDAKFDTTTDLAVTLEGIDSATLTIDGIKKVTVKNGSKVTIGDAAYPGDTVVVTLNYKHPTKGDVTKTFRYTKNSDGTTSSRSDKAIVHVKTSISGANIYAWQGNGSAVQKFVGAWPGKALSAKDADGWYVENLSDTTDAFNIIVNGSGQTKDITGLKGESWVIVNDDYSFKTFSDKKNAYEAAGISVAESDYENLKAVCKEIKLLDTAGYTEASYKAAMAKVAEADKLIAQGEDKADPAAVTAAYKEVTAAKAALVKGNDPTPVPDPDPEPTPVPDPDPDPDPEPTPIPGPVPSGKGDVNGDGSVTLRDATLVQKFALEIATPTAEQKELADVNSDGKVTLVDAYSIQVSANKAYL